MHTQPASRRTIAGLALAAALFVTSQDARAGSITITDNALFLATSATCENLSGDQFTKCTSSAHLDDVSITGADVEFKKSFDAWNDMNGAMDKWTLLDGGLIPGLAFTVTTFEAFAGEGFGGLKIIIEWTAGDGISKSDYMWSQGLFDNYRLDGTSGPAVYEMDVRVAASCNNDDLENVCAPLYPTQDDDRRFNDFPTSGWPKPDAFFEGRAFLSRADFAARTLTIHDGVHYGFALEAQPVPEPATLVLIPSGLLALRLIRRTRRPLGRRRR